MLSGIMAAFEMRGTLPIIWFNRVKGWNPKW